MNTISTLPHSSAEGAFCRPSGSSLEHQAEDLPFSPVDAMEEADREFYRAMNVLLWAAIIAGSFLAWLIFNYPRVGLVVVGILVSAIIIIATYWWATCRGNSEMGVSDTQGRDTTN